MFALWSPDQLTNGLAQEIGPLYLVRMTTSYSPVCLLIQLFGTEMVEDVCLYFALRVRAAELLVLACESDGPRQFDLHLSVCNLKKL